MFATRLLHQMVGLRHSMQKVDLCGEAGVDSRRWVQESDQS